MWQSLLFRQATNTVQSEEHTAQILRKCVVWLDNSVANSFPDATGGPDWAFFARLSAGRRVRERQTPLRRRHPLGPRKTPCRRPDLA